MTATPSAKGSTKGRKVGIDKAISWKKMSMVEELSMTSDSSLNDCVNRMTKLTAKLANKKAVNNCRSR